MVKAAPINASSEIMMMAIIAYYFPQHNQFRGAADSMIAVDAMVKLYLTQLSRPFVMVIEDLSFVFAGQHFFESCVKYKNK